jgi:hypothetical protein
MLTDDPPLLSVSESHADQIGEFMASPSAGQRAIDPMGAAVGRLKQGTGISDRPPICLIRVSHIEKGR